MPRRDDASTRRNGGSIAPRRDEGSDYWSISHRPLHTLIFLLPLVALYEIGSVLYLTDPGDGSRLTISAQSLLSRFFDAFGVLGILLPGIALVTVLLVWHILRKDPWRVSPSVVPCMGIESAAWTVPLLVFAAVVQSADIHGLSGTAAVALSRAADAFGSLPIGERLTISIGAGLYEEMLFRLVGIAAIHLVMADMCRIPHRISAVAAVLLTAIAFSLYHRDAPFADVQAALAGSLSLTSDEVMRLIFHFGAGLYFGVLYLTRGLGIAVGVHALYDAAVLVL